MNGLITQWKALAPMTSWQVGGPAEFYAEPKNLEELKACVQWARDNRHPITVLGGATNVLVADDGIDGLVICLRKFSGIKSEVVVRGSKSMFYLECWAGTSKSDLLKTFLRQKLAPALFLAGLPGDVGGGIVMNAGVGEALMPREFVEITEWVEVLRSENLQIDRIKKADLKWAYRHCEGWQPGLITRVGLVWANEPDPQVLEKVRQANHMRLSKQPLDMPSCGSTFINPPGHKAGQLIEMAGLKGLTIGQAQVSKKHANFIVNLGGAKAADIHKVIRHVEKTVHEKSGVQLKTEVVYLGRWEPSKS